MNRNLLFIFLTIVGFVWLTACKTEPKSDFKRTDNTVVMRLAAEPDRLNTVLTTNNYARQIADYLFQYLITVDPQTFELIPQLIKTLPTTTAITEGAYKGGVAYTFEILDEAVWENGTPVTAHDFAFTLKATLNPRSQTQRIRPYLDFIKDVQIDPNNPKKFTVLTTQYVLGMEAVGNTVPLLPEYIFDANGLLKNIPLSEFTDTAKVEKLAQTNPALQQFADAFNAPAASREKQYLAGSGPYRFEEWQTGQKVVLTKKENWWGDKLADRFPALVARPTRLEYRIIPEPATTLAALKAEEIDVATEIPPKDFIELRDAELGKGVYNFYTPPSLVYSCIYFNNKNPKLSDKRVRRALAHSINLDEIIQTIYDGFAERTALPVAPSAAYYDKNLKLIDFNIEKAKTLLKEAGWQDSNNNGTVDKTINGEKVELTLSCKVGASSENGKNMLELWKGTAKQAGIGIEVAPKEFTVMMDDIRNDDYEMAAAARTISPLGWEPAQDWHSEGIQGGDNNNNFQSAQADKLIDEIRVTMDKEKRYDLYRQLEKVLYDEQPSLSLFNPTARIIIHKRFKADSYSIPPGYFPNEFRLDF